MPRKNTINQNSKSSLKKERRTLNTVLYCYVEPHLAIYAKRNGNYIYGSVSAFINYLIAKEADDQESISKMADIADKKYGLK